MSQPVQAKQARVRGPVQANQTVKVLNLSRYLASVRYLNKIWSVILQGTLAGHVKSVIWYALVFRGWENPKINLVHKDRLAKRPQITDGQKEGKCPKKYEDKKNNRTKTTVIYSLHLNPKWNQIVSTFHLSLSKKIRPVKTCSKSALSNHGYGSLDKARLSI